MQAVAVPREQLAADADCCRDRDSEGMAAQTEPFKAECSAFMLSEMQLAADADLLHESNRLRMQAVAVEAKAWLRKRSPSRRSAALCAERDAAACECRLLPCKQPAANAGCCRDRDSEGNAAQTEPFKAECSAVMLSGCS